MLKTKSKLGDFEILRELGRGGMGIVYEARQVSLNRKVALKVLGDSLGMTTKAVVRFRREAEAAAKLHHTNIVPIYATGEHEGTHYYAMELVDGPSLSQVIRDLQLRRREEPQVSGRPAAQFPIQGGATQTQDPHGKRPVPEGESTVSLMPDWVAQRLIPDVGSTGAVSATHDSSSTLSATSHYFDTVAKMIADVADGLDHAHSHGVIHRDMKPSNLLLSPDGRLSINDFGLARMLEQPGMTMTGEFMGSPLYMSPEQITAGRAPLDHRTDIYSLGATLYELLTLQPPFPGERRDQVLGQIIHKEPKPPRSVNKKVPVDLETICLKAIEKDPDRRYQTAGQMAEDLRRFVNRFAISAKRAGVWSRTTKWIRRRPAVAALILLVLVVGAAAGLFAYSAHRSHLRMVEMQREKAQDDALLSAMSGDFDGAEAAIQKAEQFGASLGWIRMLRGEVALHRNHPGEALQHLEQAVRLLPDSVSAHALLTVTWSEFGDWERFYADLQDLVRMTPTTSHDFLLLGWAQYIARPAYGLSTLDEAIKRRDSGVARTSRAEARTWVAMDTSQVADAERAIEDATVAKAMLPDNPVALARHLTAFLVAAQIYADAGHDEKRAAAIAEAERDLEALQRFSGLPAVHRARIMYFRALERAPEELVEAGRIFEELNTAKDSGFDYAMALYRDGDLRRAMEVLDRVQAQGGDIYSTILGGLVVAESPGGKHQAFNAYRDAAERRPAGRAALYPQLVLRFLGRQADAVKSTWAVRDRVQLMPPWLLEWYQHLLDYNCGMITETEENLLRAAGKSRWNQCEANFFIGMTRLADGDRVGAADHFRLSVDTRVYIFFEYVWSRAFLARMEKDPAWPPWIPMRENSPKGVSP